MVSFLLKITNGHSVLDALNLASCMEADLWNNLVIRRDHLDVLCSGRLEPRNDIDLSPADQVLHFARRAYSNICLDLSGNMEPFTMSLLRQSREIFVVCTSDVASLHFARAKAHFLKDAGLGDRASVLINRSGVLTHFSLSEVERVVGLPIRSSFQNDPRGVSQAMLAGTSVNPKSALGLKCTAFAQSIAGTEKPSLPGKRRRRFVDYFAIVPSREHTAD
ncbi:MAG: hypothetical protein WDO18_17095 [Acidobacteriota bacterium]